MLTIPTSTSNLICTKYPFVDFPLTYLLGYGSSQMNHLAKGEPLTRFGAHNYYIDNLLASLSCIFLRYSLCQNNHLILLCTFYIPILHLNVQKIY